MPLQSEYLFRMTLGVGTPQMIGATRNGELRIVPVTGGTVIGPKLNGEIMPGSAADWLRVDPDGSAQIDVRLTIRAASGSMVYAAYNGIRHGSPAALAKLDAAMNTVAARSEGTRSVAPPACSCAQADSEGRLGRARELFEVG
jgi:hypothetical protein